MAGTPRPPARRARAFASVCLRSRAVHRGALQWQIEGLRRLERSAPRRNSYVGVGFLRLSCRS